MAREISTFFEIKEKRSRGVVRLIILTLVLFYIIWPWAYMFRKLFSEFGLILSIPIILICFPFVCSACHHLRIVLFPRVVFAWNDEAFYLRGLNDFVYWGEVAEVRILDINLRFLRFINYGKYIFFRIMHPFLFPHRFFCLSYRCLVIRLYNEDMIVESLSVIRKSRHLINEIFYGYGIVVDLQNSGVTCEEMLQLFKSNCKKLESDQTEEIHMYH
jgi:hypothetical protein